MSKPINLYFLSRIQDSESFQTIVDYHNSNAKPQKIKEEEQESLKKMIICLLNMGLNINDFDGFYFNYKIPQIEKEFDILKVKNQICLNIELKSHPVAEKKMFEQLKKNKWYLTALKFDLKLFTVITETMEVFCLDECGLFVSSSFQAIKEQIESLTGESEHPLDSLFKVTDYLISPLNNPVEFFHKQYFLTDDQSRIKNEVWKHVEKNEIGYVTLQGRPGTGKTLLLYDMAVSLARLKKKKVLIVHSGILSGGHYQLNNMIEDNFEIISVKNLVESKLQEAAYIFVDETHRMYNFTLRMICKAIADEKNNLFGVFSLDPGQVLSHKEKYFKSKRQISPIP